MVMLPVHGANTGHTAGLVTYCGCLAVGCRCPVVSVRLAGTVPTGQQQDRTVGQLSGDSVICH